MNDDPGQAATLMMQALEWAYAQASTAIPGLGSAQDLARTHLAKRGGDVERAVSDLIAWQVRYAGAAGFVTNLGGLITMPVSIPANLASVLLIQLRMITAIAILRGYEVSDPRVRTLSFVCLTGSSGAAILQEFGVGLGTRLTLGAITRISASTLARINQAVGFRLIAKAGAAGLVNLGKIVPIIGGIIGGGFDAAVTRGIAGVARESFPMVVKDPAQPKGPVIDGVHYEEGSTSFL